MTAEERALDAAPGVDAYESLVEDVLDSTADVAAFVLDGDYRVAWVNAAAERYFGIDRADVVGADKRLVVETHIKDRMADPEGFAETVLGTYDDDAGVEEFECHVLPGDGREERYLEHRSRRLDSGRFRGGRVELYYDVTERTRSERSLRTSRDKIRALHDAATELERSTDVEAVCESTVAAAEDVLSFDRCGIAIESDGSLRMRALSSDVSLDDVEPLTVDDGIAGLTYRTGDSMLVPDLSTEPAASPQGPFRSGLSVPIGEHGVFQAAAEETGAYDERDLELAELLVSHTREALERLDREARLRERRAALQSERDLIDRILEASPVGIAVLDADGVAVRLNEQACEQAGLSRSVMLGEPFDDLPLCDEDGEPFRPEELPHRRVLDTGEPVFGVEGRLIRPDGDHVWLSLDCGPVYDEDGELARVILTGEDVTERKRRERELRRQRDELATLNRINAVIRDVDSALVQASTRSEIEAAVADRLAAADRYSFAWVGDRNRGTDVVEPRADSGDDDGYLDDVTVTLDDDPTGSEPAGAALATGELWVAQDVGECPTNEPWRAAALDSGYRAIAGIPLTHGETEYGVLAVYADRLDAFDDRECDVLAHLGETVGHAIAAVENRKLLMADSVVELEFHTTSVDSFFLDASERLACEFDIQQIVPTTDDALLYYQRVVGADPETVCELADDDPTIGSARVVGDGDDEVMMEFTVLRSSPTMSIAEQGAQVRTSTSDHGEGRIVAAVTPDTDVRRFVETVHDSHPDLEFVSRRDREREVEIDSGIRRRLLGDGLTERQRTALEAAYYAGYFEWPRESTAEEVADVVGISSPTLHYHLRRAQQGVLARLLDDDVRGPSTDG